MRENTVKNKLRSGGVSVGSWLSLEDSLSADLMASAGFEWLMVDTEHGPVTPATAINIISACRASAAIPFLRVVWNESSLIQQGLDMGAFGILVPMVNSRAEAEAAVQDAKFSPLGQRSRGGNRAPMAFGTDSNTYGTKANETTMLMVQVETVESVRAANDIASVEGIDVLFVGPNDLSASMNEWPLTWSKASKSYKDTIASIPQIAKSHGKFAGIQVHEASFANDCIAMGYQLIGYTGDTSLLLKAAKEARAEIKG